MTWSPVSINKKVGAGLDNMEDDVKKIQTLLNLVRIGPRLEVNGQCNQETITAIGNFQKIWGNPDYRIFPNGTTLQRLNDTAKPLTLKSITLISIGSGGYAITYEGFTPPKGYKVMLFLPGSFTKIPSDAIDITKPGLNNAVVTVKLKLQDTLPRLLRLIDSKGAWGSPLACNLYLVREDRQVVSASNQINFRTPVKPYDGPIKLNMAHIDDRPMFYVGEPDNSIPSGVRGKGRYFWPQAIDGRRYFTGVDSAPHSRFETDPKMRGFDCTTYAGTVLGLNGVNGELGVTGSEMADSIGAEICEFEYAPGMKKKMENINPAMLKYFFTNNSTGAFIVWTPGHVMLVVNNIVHEFNVPIGEPGYKSLAVSKRDWGKSSKLNIRKIPSGRI